MTPPPLTRVGLQLAGYTRPGIPDRLLFNGVAESVLAAERSGFDSIWVMDHLHQISTVGEPDEPILEAYTTLAALAALTSTVRLGALVSAVGFRNPSLTAKMITTIDVISQGRAILGIGAGWHDEEYRAYGFEFPAVRERMRQLEAAILICRSMFTHGTDGALNVPPPIQHGGPPILIGGGGEKVLLPMVARLGDACNLFGGPATVRHKISVLHRACAEVGRNPDEITKTWLGTAVLAESEWDLRSRLERLAGLLKLSPSAVRGFALCGSPSDIHEQVQAYREAGIDGIIVNVLDTANITELERLGPILRAAMEA